MKFPEVGYTPANLRTLLALAGLTHLIEQRGWTQAYAAELAGVSAQTMRRWLAAVDTPSHADMPLNKWLALLQSPEKQGLH